MKRASIIKYSLFLFSAFIFISCATPEVQKPAPPAPSTNQKNNEPVETPPNPAEMSKKPDYALDPTAQEKSKALFEAIVKNDEKKAKLAYGRAAHALPEIVQFAVDLRLKNYDHAASILAKTPLSPDQQDFWSGIIKKKPKKLETAVCDGLIANTSFPPPGAKTPDEEASWLKYYDEVAQKIVNPDGLIKEHSDLTKSLERVICTDRECGPVPDNVRDELLNDKFFDNVHNMRRRDTRFFKENFKSPLKLWQYRPYVSDIAILKFHRALKNTPYDKQNHFLRRLKGIARDMRSDTILSRSVADLILVDDQDLALAKRLGNFLTSNSLISAITRLEGQLPSCRVPTLQAAPGSTPSN